MGNCGPCTRANTLQNQPVPTKQDLIEQFEAALPFNALFIDEFEQIVMAAARIQKLNQQYEPPLHTRNLSLRRLVKYFKGIDEWSTIKNPSSSLHRMLRSKFLSAETFFVGGMADFESHQQQLNMSMSSVGSSVLNQSVTSNGSVHEEVDNELDTECFLLFGLLFCKDHYNRKAQVFYSILKSGSNPSGLFGSSTTTTQNLDDQSDKFDELYCMDEAVEKTIFKMNLISSMFIEYYALPSRPGRTETKMLQ